LDPTASIPIFDAPAAIVERVLDVNVPWSFDDSNEESLMGDLSLDTQRMKAMFTKESMEREAMNVAGLPARMWNIAKSVYQKAIGWFEISYAKVNCRSPRDVATAHASGGFGGSCAWAGRGFATQKRADTRRLHLLMLRLGRHSPVRDRKRDGHDAGHDLHRRVVHGDILDMRHGVGDE
jgi:hypothetical protein